MEKNYTNVTFRVPTEIYTKYKIILLTEQEVGRRTPTADLNYYINSVVIDEKLRNLESEEKS